MAFCHRLCEETGISTDLKDQHIISNCLLIKEMLLVNGVFVIVFERE
jgi:hypothetical protein